MLLLAVCMVLTSLCMTGCGDANTTEGSQDPSRETAVSEAAQQVTEEETGPRQDGELPDRDGVYDGKDEVALYLYAYGQLPRNYITKKEARSMGWQGGSLERYAPGKCIGGDHFGNYEKRLPKGEYHECDIDTLGADDRGPRRLVYTDEDIYYTGDHYRTFEQLYDKDGKL